MRSVKLAFGLLAAILPVAYCGYLFFYFLGTGQSPGAIGTSGLGPTLLGLGAIGLLLLIPLVFRLLKLVTGSGAARTAVPDSETESSFDPDAVIARYLERRAAEGYPPPQPESSTTGAAPERPVFGRKPG